jgi:hypothetical protein
MPRSKKPANTQDAKKALEKAFGSRESFWGFELITLSQTGQPFDVTFYDRKPILEVTLGPKLFSAIAYGAGPKKLAELLNHLEFSDGTVAAFGQIWTIHPMPKGGFSEAELAAVDLSHGEERLGPNGETLREMIRNTYQCASTEEEDHFFRRYLAS